MLRPVPTLEMPTLNAFGDLFKGCDFAVRESAEDLEAIMRRIELDNQHSRVDRAQAPVILNLTFCLSLFAYEASDGEDDSPLIVKKRKRTLRTAKVSEKKETAQVQAETEQGVKQTTLGERTTEQTKPTTKSLMAPKVPMPRTHPPIVAVYETQIKNAEIAPVRTRGRILLISQKGSFHILPFSCKPQCAFVMSAPTAKEKMANMEGSASSPMDTEIAPKPFVTADGKTFRTPDKVSFLLSGKKTFGTPDKATLVSDVVPLSFHQAGDVIFKVPNDDEEEMKNDKGVESLGSAANRSLQRLLELEDLPESSSVSTEVEVAKDVLAI
ncbi:hypothetical protein L3X38_045485 [Prunus dulcis]|uniref:Uncharacterized protein n=1 Tax=Prunus dulcis TaxID=3755 RepID=A0AAD4UNX3_PRUDU|nr:hypothetical protein L3X38_040745 [Prunus dulcis]KAI5310962.1 hypothetical protein L3X38_045485 [Prunus dulcis]